MFVCYFNTGFSEIVNTTPNTCSATPTSTNPIPTSLTPFDIVEDIESDAADVGSGGLVTEPAKKKRKKKKKTVSYILEKWI